MFTQLLKTDDISSNIALEQNRLGQNGMIYNDFAPVRHKSILASGWKGSHSNRFRIKLLLIKDWKVSFNCVTKFNRIVHKIFSCGIIRLLIAMTENKSAFPMVGKADLA
jgi:hypothetical protein